MEIETFTIGENVERIVLRNVPFQGRYVPGQAVAVVGGNQPGPVWLTITSPPAREELTFHVKTDSEHTQNVVQSIKKGKAQFSAPHGAVTILQPKYSVAVVSDFGASRVYSVTPLVPILKAYLIGDDEDLPDSFQAYIILDSEAMYTWFMICFEEFYKEMTLPAHVRVNIYPCQGIRKDRLDQGTTLETGFAWHTKSNLPTFEEVDWNQPATVPVGIIGHAATVQKVTENLGVHFNKTTKNLAICKSNFGFTSSDFFPRELNSKAPPPVPGYFFPTNWMFRATDPMALGLFRICFGVIIGFFKMRQFYHQRGIYNNHHLIARIPYDGFEWVPRLEGAPVWVLLTLCVVSAFGLASGRMYKFWATMFTITYTWQWLFDATYFNNHYYFISLCGILFMITDANKFGTLDLQIFGRDPVAIHKVPKASSIPYWQVWIFKTTVGMVYFWAAIAKINYDWMRGYPFRIHLSEVENNWIGPNTTMAIACGMTWSGFLLDLCAPFLLCYPVWRHHAIFATVTFHLMNSTMFTIGTFPWIMIATSMLFVETHTCRLRLTEGIGKIGCWAARGSTLSRWCLRLRSLLHICYDEVWFARFFKEQQEAVNQPLVQRGNPANPAFGPSSGPGPSSSSSSSASSSISFGSTPSSSSGSGTDGDAKKRTKTTYPSASMTPGKYGRMMLFAFVFFWMAAHTILPLRHHYFMMKNGPGMQTAWSEVGHRWSWRMMLRWKNCTGTFTMTDEISGQTEVMPIETCGKWPVILTNIQCTNLLTRPDCVRYFGKEAAKKGREMWKSDKVRVTVDAQCGLNGSPTQPYLDPSVDISDLPDPGFGNPEKFLLPQTKFV